MARGQYAPDPRNRTLLARHYNIPVSAWVPDIKVIPKAARKAPEPDELDEPADDDDDPNDDKSVADDYDLLLRSLRKQLRDHKLTAREQIQLTDAMGRVAAKKARLEREQESQEDRVVRNHPKWKALKAAIIKALLPHPAAARDVQTALSTLLADEADDD